jgi:hypothetical protein
MPTVEVAEPIVNQTIAPIVQQAVQSVSPFGMKINPWFDWATILNLPAWLWITAVFFLILLTVNLLWVFRLKRLAPVRGYVIALKKATQEDVMVWIISTTKNLTIECLKKRDTVLSFYDKLNITKWTHTSPMSVIHIGGKGGIITSEDYTRSRDMVSEIAICYACDEFNADQIKLKEELKGKEVTIKPINNYDDYEEYGREILQQIHPDGLKIPSYSIFDPNKFRKYFPAGETATLQGGIIIRDARKLKVMGKVPTFWEKMLPMGVCMTLGLVAMAAAWFVPLGK